MPNPFEEHFAHDLAAQKRQAALEAERQQELLSAAAKERAQAYENNVQHELNTYEPLVLELLEQLRAATYQNLVVGSRGDGSYGYEDDPGPVQSYWHLGLRRKFKYSLNSPKLHDIYTRECLVDKVTVGLEISQSGMAQSFICRYYGDPKEAPGEIIQREPFTRNGFVQLLDRERKAPLTRDGLVQTLIEMHQPDPMLVTIAEHDSHVRTALQTFLQTQVWNKLHPPGFSYVITPNKVVTESLRNPSSDCLESMSAGTSGEWEVTYSERVGKEFDPDPPRDIPGRKALKVKLILGTNGTPVHYECYVYPGSKLNAHYMSLSSQSSSREEWIHELTEKAPLGQQELVSTLVALITKANNKELAVEAEKQALIAASDKKKRKGWFGR